MKLFEKFYYLKVSKNIIVNRYTYRIIGNLIRHDYFLNSNLNLEHGIYYLESIYYRLILLTKNVLILIVY